MRFRRCDVNKKITLTNEKIYKAFAEALLEKDYEDMRIQDVLDKSGVARSTFYSHYKTKEDLLKSVCSTIFGHVFSHTLEEEKSHDFSKSSLFDYKHFITHILYHLHDEKTLIHAILLSQGRDLFLEYLRSALDEFATACVDNGFVKTREVPRELRVDLVKESFILIVKYWDKTGFKDTPETLTEYFISLENISGK